MRKVFQTKFGKEHGNCMNACLASLLELKIEVVPDFGNSPDWWEKMSLWLTGYGYSPIEIIWDEDTGMIPGIGQVCWGVGKSPRGPFRHAALYQWKGTHWGLIHDPHPDGDGLGGPIESVGFLVPMEIKPLWFQLKKGKVQ